MFPCYNIVYIDFGFYSWLFNDSIFFFGDVHVYKTETGMVDVRKFHTNGLIFISVYFSE